jgi:glutathionyl-hydroquinone reductase
MALGMMIRGKWTNDRDDRDASGKFQKKSTTFRDRITADGSSGFKAEVGRYHIYAASACPWAHRTLITREIKGLNDAISVSLVEPIMSDRGWKFSDAGGDFPDLVNNTRYLQEIYVKADAEYTGTVTVPVLWDKQTQTIVNNESREIMRMLDVEFASLAARSIDLYPEELQQNIDKTIDDFLSINVGVYNAGFAISQAAYEEAIGELFEHLGRWEVILGQQRYVCGDRLTEADICLFATLYRFDLVYYGLFKCNLRRIIDYPNLWNYLKDLYQHPEFKITCKSEETKFAYYRSMTDINPHGIVPKGPIVDFDEPHDRDRFGKAYNT